MLIFGPATAALIAPAAMTRRPITLRWSRDASSLGASLLRLRTSLSVRLRLPRRPRWAILLGARLLGGAFFAWRPRWPLRPRRYRGERHTPAGFVNVHDPNFQYIPDSDHFV